MRVSKYLIIIIFPIIIILSNFLYLTFNFNLYKDLYTKTGVYNTFNNKEVANNATSNLLGYFRGQNQLDQNFYSIQAILHLKDVKGLINLTAGLLSITLILFLILSAVLIAKKEYTKLSSALAISSLSVIGFMILLLLGISNIFDQIFIKFHEIVFTNDLWLFPQDDNLIKLFPQQFFVLFAQKVSINIFSSSAIILFLSLSVILKKTFKKSKRK